MVRLTEWPRNPYLNDELHEWVRLHLDALGVEDVAVFATASGREDDERRILVVTEVGLLDGWYAPRGSTARYSLSVRLYPWQAVHGVDLRGETFRLWAHEHQSRWRLRLARPALDTVADSPELGRALTQFAAACSVMAEPAGATEAVEAPETAALPPLRPAAKVADEGHAEAGLMEPEAPAEARNDGPPAMRPPHEPLLEEEVVATIGDLEPPRLRAPIRSEPDPGDAPRQAAVPAVPTEPGTEDERALDLARRLGLR